MSATSVTDLVLATRQLADMVFNQACTDAEIATYLSDAQSDLYDMFTRANQRYNLSTFAFTLAGGVDGAGNVVDLPDDFVQGHGLVLNPGTANPLEVPYEENWLNRYDTSAASAIFSGVPTNRQYIVANDQLYVYPPGQAAGSYMLWYTPAVPQLMLPVAVPNPGTVMSVGFGSGSLTGWGAGTFTQADVGEALTISGAVNPQNNGTFTVLSVNVAGDALALVETTLVAESFSGSVSFVLQAAGTSGAVSPQFTPWLVYMKLYAAIMCRLKLQKPVAALQEQMGLARARIESTLQSRVEEPQQPPLTRRGGDWLYSV